jgi:hypothetical protein
MRTRLAASHDSQAGHTNSCRADGIALDYQQRIKRLDATRLRIEEAYRRGILHPVDVEASYAGLFLQAVVAYETSMEDFVLGLMARPGGVVSGNSSIRGRIKVRGYSHAQQLTSGPGGR